MRHGSNRCIGASGAPTVLSRRRARQPVWWSTAFLLLVACAGASPPGEVVLSKGESLYYLVGSRQVLVRKLEHSSELQGYGLVDKTSVFLAYSTPGSEASTILSVWDSATRREFIVYELGGTGESQFSLDSETKWVVFDWNDGIYVFSVDGLPQELKNRTLDRGGFERRFLRVVDCVSCFEPRWLGPLHLAYQQWEGSCLREKEVQLSPSDLEAWKHKWMPQQK